MRRALLILVLTLLVTGCRPPDRTPLAHHESRTFAAPAGKLVRCDLRSLDLEVVVKEGDAITAVVDLEASASSSAFARRWIENHTPSFADSADTLEIKVPSRHRSSLIVGYIRTEGSIVLTLPPRCRLEVASSSGDITVEGSAPLAAPVRLTTSSGDVEIAGGVWHTLLALAPDTMLFEVKPGPYAPLSDKHFAPWAPREGAAAAADLLARWARLLGR